MTANDELPDLPVGKGSHNSIIFTVEAIDHDHGTLGGLILYFMQQRELILQVEVDDQDDLEVLVPYFDCFIQRRGD